jgi:hypothetical protein
MQAALHRDQIVVKESGIILHDVERASSAQEALSYRRLSSDIGTAVFTEVFLQWSGATFGRPAVF